MIARRIAFKVKEEEREASYKGERRHCHLNFSVLHFVPCHASMATSAVNEKTFEEAVNIQEIWKKEQNDFTTSWYEATRH